ncbi:MAG: PqqD family peptide modification chaperone [Acidimicrobiales bacterium]
MTAAARSPRLAQGAEVFARHIRGGVLLLGPTDREPLQLLGAAALVWAGLAQPTTTDALVRRLATDCGLEASQIDATVADVIAELGRRRLTVAAP